MRLSVRCLDVPGLRGEYFDPETLKISSSGELHKRMGWVMAEAGVPWEKGDQTWCCPECFIIFGLNVFRVSPPRRSSLADEASVGAGLRECGPGAGASERALHTRRR